MSHNCTYVCIMLPIVATHSALIKRKRYHLHFPANRESKTLTKTFCWLQILFPLGLWQRTLQNNAQMSRKERCPCSFLLCFPGVWPSCSQTTTGGSKPPSPCVLSLSGKLQQIPFCHPVHCVSTLQSWCFVKHFSHVPLAVGLILQLLCSPIGNRNFQKKRKQNITTEGTKHSVVYNRRT